MEPELIIELENLKKELETLHSAVTHINEAKEVATNAVNAAQKVTEASEAVLSQYQNLYDITQRVISKLDTVDFTKELESINKSIDGMNLYLKNDFISSQSEHIQQLKMTIEEKTQNIENGTNELKGLLVSSFESKMNDLTNLISERSDIIDSTVEQYQNDSKKYLIIIGVIVFIILIIQLLHTFN